jgi:cytochrome P450
VRESLDSELFRLIRERRVDPGLADRVDVFSELVRARDVDGEAMSDQEIRDELVTLLVAGHETTATALAWAFDLLLHDPATLHRLEAEAAGDRREYLDATIKETLRLRPPVVIVVRRVKVPFPLDGREVPAGAHLCPNIYLTQRRPDLYPEPDRFRPERFLEEAPEPYAWLPFGGGIRRCLGASFATAEMRVVIPEMLRRVRLRPASPRPERVRRETVLLVPDRGTRVVASGRSA